MSHPVAGAELTFERRALRVALVASVLIGVIGIVWGVFSDSRIMLFDGVYTLFGTALSGFSLLAAWYSARGEDPAFPFGRQASIPIAIVVQGAALLGTLTFALVDSVGLLFTGGTTASSAAVIVYAGITVIVSLVVIWLMPRIAPNSELVAAELNQWKADTVLTALIGVGAMATIGLVALGVHWLAPYGDPLLVILAVLGLIPVALGMLRDGGRELLEAAPEASLSEEIRAAASHVARAHGLGEPLIRATKLGRRLYVEVDYVVPPGTWDVAGEDEVRRDVHTRLDALGYDLWPNVGLTADPSLVE